MKYTIEMGSGALIYIPSFIKIGSGIQKVVGGEGCIDHRQHGDLISLPLLFQNKERRLKMSFNILTKASCGVRSSVIIEPALKLTKNASRHWMGKCLRKL
jgi:hypothetical protein